MRHFKIIAFGALLAAFSSCQTDAETDNAAVPFKISEQSIEFEYTGGEKVLSLTSATEWSIRSTDESWLTVSPSSGSGNAQVTVIALRNGSKEEGRTAKLVCSYDDLSVNVTVSQGINPEEAVFSITPSQISLGPEGGQFSIEVVSDAVPYDITVVDDWISRVSQEGDRYNGETIVFEAKTNSSGPARTGIVSVCTDNGSCIPVTVTQEGGSHHHTAFRFTATWCGYCPYMDEAFHEVARQSRYFDYVTFHDSAGYPLYFADAAPFNSAYNITGFPTGVLNGWKEINNTSSSSATAKNIISAMDKFDEEFPCLVKITFSSSIQNGEVQVDAEITSSMAGDLKVVALLLESGIIETQTYYTPSGGTQKVSDFSHDNVARKLLSSSIFGDNCTAEADKAVPFHWTASLDSDWDTNNLSVYVGVFRSYNDLSGAKASKNYPDSYIENSRLSPVGQAVNE